MDTAEDVLPPRVISLAANADVQMRLAETLRSHPKLAHLRPERALLPEMFGMSNLPVWVCASSFDVLAKGAEEAMKVSLFFLGATLRPGDALVCQVRGLAYKRGSLPHLHEGVFVAYYAPGTEEPKAVVVFDTEGLALLDHAFNTAPPVKSAHAERWFRRRWNRAMPDVSPEDPYPSLKQGRMTLVNILEPLALHAIRALADAPTSSAASV